MSGVANVASRHKKVTPIPTATTPETITPTDVHPAIGPMLSTSMAAVTPPARLQLPTQSMPFQTFERFPAALAVALSSDGTGPPARAFRRVGSSTATTTDAMTNNTSWPQNNVRHPKYWITG